MKPREATTFKKVCSLKEDNYPRNNFKKWSILVSDSGVSIHPPSGDNRGYFEIPRKDFNAIVDWYNEDQKPLAMRSKGQPIVGCGIKIYWKEIGDYDRGYLYQPPKMEDDFMVHIPGPINPGGKDSCDPIWIRLSKLLKNDQVEKVTYLKP